MQNDQTRKKCALTNTTRKLQFFPTKVSYKFPTTEFFLQFSYNFFDQKEKKKTKKFYNLNFVARTFYNL
ncbi:hypothetical protein HanXRQr2_Chr02g0082911 [Helianthus annuus]|uniref:Uncharacterized protein n=1 Tax=Helianthus annuus TaxID=4232 RepID=A0A9K3P091_HELAN|nr:hypothetical protein HanXRQr2_Chr02g0082911 [Helianthus annuus]KAJ0953119.1 hypothetical protein HanPSC8_Chr02g0080281 [Helianthus annuus]